LYQGGTRVTVRHEDFGHSQPAFEHAAGWEHLLEWLAAYLYSLQGFQYCDLLLAEAEREAGKAHGEVKQEALLSKCRAVSERAAKMFEWRVSSDPLLTIALEHLTLGRATLYAEILESRSRLGESAPPPPASQPSLASAATEIEQAVSGLRRAGQQYYLPRGLLTRA